MDLTARGLIDLLTEYDLDTPVGILAANGGWYGVKNVSLEADAEGDDILRLVPLTDIAAAPDLLAALIGLRLAVEVVWQIGPPAGFTPELSRQCKRADAAIARATGERA